MPIPGSLMTFNGSSYCFCWNKQSWRTAQSDCKGLGSELVKITSNAENDFIGNKIVDQHHCWIGLNDIDTENSFKWSVDNSSIQDNGNYSSTPPRSKPLPITGDWMDSFLGVSVTGLGGGQIEAVEKQY
ncbi:CD209 antigen-like protein E isoform X2 [Macrobrachium nipponense]|uniref:CD209 antigen-like protein E isoform X2 n=1 Tax=Macrobrachium nipponense TaxID=159736 RepID=UPI0030C7A436